MSCKCGLGFCDTNYSHDLVGNAAGMDIQISLKQKNSEAIAVWMDGWTYSELK